MFSPRLVLYEPPLAIDGPIMDDSTIRAVEDAVARGAFEDALALHLGAESGGMSEPEIEALRTNPMLRPVYADLVIQAPTIAPGVESANRLRSAEPYRSVTTPTRVLLGAQSPARPFRHAAEALVDAMPGADLHVLDGQTHLALMTAPHLVAGAIRELLEQ